MVRQEGLLQYDKAPVLQSLQLRCDLSATEKSGNRKENAMVEAKF